MATKKITQLPPATQPLGQDDIFAVVQGGTTKQADISGIATIYNSDGTLTASRSIYLGGTDVSVILDAENPEDNYFRIGDNGSQYITLTSGGDQVFIADNAGINVYGKNLVNYTTEVNPLPDTAVINTYSYNTVLTNSGADSMYQYTLQGPSGIGQVYTITNIADAQDLQITLSGCTIRYFDVLNEISVLADAAIQIAPFGSITIVSTGEGVWNAISNSGITAVSP